MKSFDSDSERRIPVPKFLAVAGCTLLLTSCAHLDKAAQQRDSRATDEVRITATPKAQPQRAITNFSESLRCMDRLFVRYRINGLRVGAQDIPDQTEVVLAGTKDMLISALSQMSIESGAISFVALGQDLEDITRFHTLHRNKNFTAPDFFIRGAITQADRGVVEQQTSGGVALARVFSLSASKDRSASIIALDMNVGLVSNLQILPGITSSNSIAVARKGKGFDLSGTIKKLGAVFQVDFTESEGLHHAVRTLVELGAIELMGRLTQVAYWECLDIDSTSTFVQKQVEDWYKSLSSEEFTKFIQAKLSTLGLYDGPVDGNTNDALRSAIALYKRRKGLLADSRQDYMLYFTLLGDETPIGDAHREQFTRHGQESADLAATGATDASSRDRLKLPSGRKSLRPLALALTTNRGERPVFVPGERITLDARLSIDGHLYCYYQSATGDIVKIFPNRFRPSSRVRAAQSVRIPGDQGFEIRADRPGSDERVLCMGSYEDVEKRMPFELKGKSLQPLAIDQLTRLYRRKVASLDDLYAIYKSSAKIVPIRQALQFEVQ